MDNAVDYSEPGSSPLDDSNPDICILDTAPDSFSRLLVLLKGKGYSASWVYIQRHITERQNNAGEMVQLPKPETEVHQELVIIREDGQLFTNAPMPNAKLLKDLNMNIHLDDIPANDRLWSGNGINRYVSGKRPDTVSVFNDLCGVVNHYMDFHGSFGDQDGMAELIACYIMTTYMLDAFPVTGYLWPNGEPGSGKSHLLMIIAVMAYLGQFITAGGSFASIRDLAGYGATMCFDDAEKIMDKGGDPDKQSLLLAGNRKGTTIPVKVADTDKKWVIRQINAYCPRCFSAVGLPNDTLSSRTIFIPLLSSDDNVKSNSDPLDFDSWPIDHRRLIDDLWALSLMKLKKLPRYDKQAARESGMSGRAYQPWRSIMAVALWLQDEGCGGLFDRMKALTAAYGKESTFSAGTHKALVLKALREIVDRRPGTKDVIFATKELKDEINKIALDSDLMDEKFDREGVLQDYINSRSLGWRLNRMRLKRPPGRNANNREWVVSVGELERLERANSIPQSLTSQTSETAQTTPDTPENDEFTANSDVNDVSAVYDVSHEGRKGKQHPYKYRLTGGEGGTVLTDAATVDAARNELFKKYGSRLVTVED